MSISFMCLTIIRENTESPLSPWCEGGPLLLPFVHGLRLTAQTPEAVLESPPSGFQPRLNGSAEKCTRGETYKSKAHKAKERHRL